MKVLLATDGSPRAEEAAQLLAHFPHAERLELTILAVAPSLEMHGSREVMEWMKRDANAIHSRLQAICHRIERIFEGADASVERLIVEGHAGNVIVDEAKRRGSQLVVLGATGHSKIERMLIGSVSDFVATHASCSVLLVRTPQSDQTPHEKFNVTIAFDGSPQSRFAIQDLSNFRWGSRTQAFLVNAFAFPFNYSEIPIDMDTGTIKADLHAILDKASEDVRALFPQVQCEVLETSHVGDGIIHFAEQHASDLIVLGDTGHSLMGRFLMGSVSRYVLRHAHSSVWIARKPVE